MTLNLQSKMICLQNGKISKLKTALRFTFGPQQHLLTLKLIYNFIKYPSEIIEVLLN